MGNSSPAYRIPAAGKAKARTVRLHRCYKWRKVNKIKGFSPTNECACQDSVASIDALPAFRRCTRPHRIAERVEKRIFNQHGLIDRARTETSNPLRTVPGQLMLEDRRRDHLYIQ